MKIAIIGTGNVATFLIEKVRNTDWTIIQIIGKDAIKNNNFLLPENLKYSNQIEDLDKNVDVVLVCVTDNVVLSVINKISIENRLIIYFSGSLPLHIFQNRSNTIACIWPIFSIQKNNIPTAADLPLIISYLESIPIIHQKLFMEIVAAISNNYNILNDHQKEVLHLCATITNNFSNHLFTIAKDILDKENIEFKSLLPLILNTTEKLRNSEPNKNQTGAAIRGDSTTMQKHEALLLDNPQNVELYKLMSKLIMEYYLTKKE